MQILTNDDMNDCFCIITNRCSESRFWSDKSLKLQFLRFTCFLISKKECKSGTEVRIKPQLGRVVNENDCSLKENVGTRAA